MQIDIFKIPLRLLPLAYLLSEPHLDLKTGTSLYSDSYLIFSDTAHLSKLRQLGMKRQDEVRLKDMRQHILKVAHARARLLISRTSQMQVHLYHPVSDPFHHRCRLPPPHPTLEATNLLNKNVVPLQDFGAPLHTILLKTPSPSDSQTLLGAAAGLSVTTPHRKVSADMPRSPSSTDMGRAHLKINSPVISDLRRIALKGVAPSEGTHAKLSELRDFSMPVSQTSSSHTDVHSLSSSVELSTGPSTKRILDSQYPASNSKGFDVSKANPAIASDTTLAFGTLGVETRHPSARLGSHDPSLLSSTPADQLSMNSYLHPAPPPMLHQRFSSTYEGHDANIRYLLERVFLDSYREPLTEFGPVVNEGIPKKRAFRSLFSSRNRPSMTSTGNLVGHLVEHTALISSIAVSPDFVFFVTGSHDGTVKVWDSLRLEKNVTSKSRHTYSQGGKITCLCILENSHCIASASTNGTLWVHRIDVAFDGPIPVYGKRELIRQHRLETGSYITSMLHFNTSTSSTLIYTTNRCQIITMNLRTMQHAQTLKSPTHLGPLTCFCVGSQKIWLVAGTTRGYLTLWDLRFGLLLRTWNVAEGRIKQLTLHPTQGKGRWVVVAAQFVIGERDSKQPTPILQIWDLDHNKIIESFIVSNTSAEVAVDRFRAEYENQLNPTPTNQATELKQKLAIEMKASSAIEGFLLKTQRPINELKCHRDGKQIRETNPLNPKRINPNPTFVHSFLIGSQYHESTSSSIELVPMPEELGNKRGQTKPMGYLITAGEDRMIRFWDLSAIERSGTVSGLQLEADRPHYRLS